jgi:uncharacterized protein YbbK (DUF523 family)
LFVKAKRIHCRRNFFFCWVMPREANGRLPLHGKIQGRNFHPSIFTVRNKGEAEMRVVSACLMGCQCRYDKGTNEVEAVAQMVKNGEAVPVCPEQLGGLPTPRNPAEIVGGDGFDVLDGKAKVIDNQGRDVTRQFLDGALQTLRIAQTAGAREAVLKERSPSCGSRMIYDGTFSRTTKQGVGVTAALLMRNGIRVISEEQV